MRKISLMISIILATLSAGCIPSEPLNPYVPPTINPDGQASIQIAQAATRVSESLAQLAALDKAMHPGVALPPPPNPASIGMAQLASVDWNGPLEELLRKIALATHYDLHVIGRRSALVPTVDVVGTNITVADILRDVEFQSLDQARIKLYPAQHVIELRYLTQ